MQYLFYHLPDGAPKYPERVSVTSLMKNQDNNVSMDGVYTVVRGNLHDGRPVFLHKIKKFYLFHFGLYCYIKRLLGFNVKEHSVLMAHFKILINDFMILLTHVFREQLVH